MTECLIQKVFFTLESVVSHTRTDDVIVYANDDVIVDDDVIVYVDNDDVDVFLSDYTNTGTSLRRVCPL